MIVDANVAAYWCVPSPLAQSASLVFAHSGIKAPDLIRVESTNALLKYVRAGIIDDVQLHAGMELIEQSIEEFVEHRLLLRGAVELSLHDGHPVYDCLYLALAMERREPLATADRKLAGLARQLGVQIELVAAA